MSDSLKAIIVVIVSFLVLVYGGVYSVLRWGLVAFAVAPLVMAVYVLGLVIWLERVRRSQEHEQRGRVDQQQAVIEEQRGRIAQQQAVIEEQRGRIAQQQAVIEEQEGIVRTVCEVEFLADREGKSIDGACKLLDVGRSTYYKYKKMIEGQD